MASTRQSSRQVRKRFSIKPQRHSSDQPYSCRVLMDFVRYGESILEQQSFFNSTQETRDVENHFLEGFSSSIAFEAFRGEHGDCGYSLTCCEVGSLANIRIMYPQTDNFSSW